MVYNANMQPQFYGAAAEYNKPKGFRLNKRVFLFLGLAVIVILLVVIGLGLFSSLTSASRNNLARLIVREQQLVKFIDTNESAVKSSDLKRIGSDGVLYLTTDSQALRKTLSGGVPEEISKEELDTTSTAKLKSATQANKYDDVYKQLLADKLSATLKLAQTVAGENKGNTKKAADQTVSNLKDLAGQLEAAQ